MPRETHCNARKHAKKSSSSVRHKSSSHQSEAKRSATAQDDRKSGPKLGKSIDKITENDYFQRQTEFRVWLTQTKNKYIDDLSTTEALHMFTAEFAKKWNRGKLATMFYKGLPDVVVAQTKRTRHCWDFVAKLGEKEKFELATAKDSVDVATKKESLLSFGGKRATKGPLVEENHNKRRSAQEKDDDKDEIKRRKVKRQKERELRDTLMDEIVPKETGREAQIEKRRQVGAKLHGAARDREDARDGLDLSEDFLMGGHGGDNNDLNRQLTRRDLARRRKKVEQEERLEELEAKESARMDKFLKDMGLTGPNAGKSATIVPRR